MFVRILAAMIMCFGTINLIGQTEGFEKIDQAHSLIDFSNNITEDATINIMKYDYLYNGAGVGIGDFNQDGLPDIYFAGNMVKDRLYLNEGGFKFQDVSESAGIGHDGWSSGVCVFDVNQDGLPDIYVCRTGPYDDSEKLKNLLYINQGDAKFKEAAAEYGLDISGHHTQAAPLDIDLDGDLDLYILGHPGSFQHKKNFQEILEEINKGLVEHDILLENVGGKYVDITESAGIFEYGYGLGLAISDINLDGYPDILVGNDFDEPDHLFINQQNNTFKDENLKYFRHTSNYSMGNDVGDINNDGLPDYICVDMAFEDHKRSKTNMASMNPEKFYARVKLGWGYQYMHNMLQLNTGMGTFQEIAQYAGVAKTDWSWAPLFMDIDMDGYQDLFITNGYKRDTKNNDIGFLLEKAKEEKGELSVEEFLELIPAVKIENFFFRNNGDLTFSDQRAGWGVDEKVNSNGAAYADFDLDGDLDLVLNNVDAAASIYENRSDPTNYLIIETNRLKDAELLGIRFEAFSQGKKQSREAYFVRGYASTVERKINFYSPKDMSFDSLMVYLPSGEVYVKTELKSNQRIELTSELEGFKKSTQPSKKKSQLFTEVTKDYRLDAAYIDNEYNDFKLESLLPHQLSTQGPVIKVADFDKNGLEDFIVSSAVMKIPAVFLQNPNGTFKQMLSRSFYNHQTSEELGIAIFDVNGDQNLDLFMSSGGYQFAEGDTALENRLYIGNGLGMFGLVENGVHENRTTNSGKVIKHDIDADGDTDFLVCGAAYPKKYPYPGKTKIFINEKGFFYDKTKTVAPDIEQIGLVNDAVFSDVDADGDQDILLVGEWMALTWMENIGGKFVKRKEKLSDPGWWSCIEAVDIDQDGDEDYLLGNAGTNNKFHPTRENALEVYANDFDDNGQLDIVLAKAKEESRLPVRGRECSSGQMPFIKDKFPTYEAFATSSLEEIYSKEKLDRSLHYRATEFHSGIVYNNGKDGFSFKPLPAQAQFSFINDFEVLDINKDGLPDIIAVGNRYNTEVETTRYDAHVGLVLLQNADGTFSYQSPINSGFYVPHNAKSLAKIRLGKERKTGFLVGNNNGPIQLFILND